MALLRPTSKPRASIEEYSERYSRIAAHVMAAITAADSQLTAEHVGSTAIPGCAGKGIIDLLVTYAAGYRATPLCPDVWRIFSRICRRGCTCLK